MSAVKPRQDGTDPMRAICAAAGWPYCEEHNRPRRTPGCFHLHQPEPNPHHYWCDWPDRDCICDGKAAP